MTKVMQVNLNNLEWMRKHTPKVVQRKIYKPYWETVREECERKRAAAAGHICGFCEKKPATFIYAAYDGDTPVCDECYKWATDSDRADVQNRGDY